MTAGLAGSFAGPVGTALGATIGLGIDYAANTGVELIQRGEFVQEVQGMVTVSYTHLRAHET